jgi:uncharacterized NAD(P)/FAD-binding protein YdhS
MQASSQSSHGAAEAVSVTPSLNTRAVTQAPLIAIIGAGFSGTAVAIHLLRRAPPKGLRIALVDPRGEPGAGVAYATRDYPYPLNVAAGQMSLDSENPQDFLDFARGTGIRAEATDYLPRQVFGEYLRVRLAGARAAASAKVLLAHHRASALQLRRTTSGRFGVWLDDGSMLEADQVVLALGNPPPACLREIASIAATERYIGDPWSLGKLAHQEIQSVLLVGSGLTMIDAALRLAAIRPRLRHIHILSRHGWLPQPQAFQPAPAIRPDVHAALDTARGSIRALFRSLRAAARTVVGAGGDWREVLALARSQLPEVWQGLNDAERARFLRHGRSAWDIHRHRVPAGPLGAVHALARLGVLEVHAGRLVEVNAYDDTVEVIWRPRGATRTRAWLVDRVVNCTGPDPRAERSTDPLVQSLLSSGLVRCDARALGIDVAADGRVISRDGSAVDRLYYIGPWLRARDWEATAVPELREHAAVLAKRLLSNLETIVKLPAAP